MPAACSAATTALSCDEAAPGSPAASPTSGAKKLSGRRSAPPLVGHATEVGTSPSATASGGGAAVSDDRNTLDSTTAVAPLATMSGSRSMTPR